jgi:type II secretory pathway component PulF
MSEERRPISTATAIAATALAVVHTALLLGAVVLLMQTAPAMKRQYDDFGMRLPYATEMTLQLSMMMTDYSWAVGILGVVFVAVDVFVFVLLASHRRTRILAWAWAIAVTIGLLALPGPIWMALLAPQFKLMEALTR